MPTGNKGDECELTTNEEYPSPSKVQYKRKVSRSSSPYKVEKIIFKNFCAKDKRKLDSIQKCSDESCVKVFILKESNQPRSYSKDESPELCPIKNEFMSVRHINGPNSIEL